MKDYPVRVEKQCLIGPGVYRLVVSGQALPSYAPGQFGLLSVPDGARILPRPLGIAHQDGDQVELFYRVVGKGTAAWAALERGSSLTLRGPAGGSFKAPQGPTVAFAGTLGVVPLLRWRQVYGPFEALCLGVPDQSWEPFVAFLKPRIPELHVTSDDGSLGKKGSCLSLLSQFPDSWALVACGPNGMMKALSKMLSPHCRWEVSLERRMGCGFGGCHGCVVPLRGGAKRLCVDGPVLDGNEVVWDEL